jgi:predicted lipid-binding transport protein (Tim44 family)
MKRWLVALSVALCSLTLMPEADARRLGGGGSAGLKRDLPARTTPDAVPAKPAAPTQAAPAAAAGPTGAAAAAPKRSWLGPVAGLAAGLGLAALMSHLGLGAEFANFLMLALLALAAFVVIRLVMRRFAGAAPRPALATPNGMPFRAHEAPGASATAPQRSAVAPVAPAQAPVASTLPADFDAAAFERIAKMIFIRMQAANDAGDLNDLRGFTTPELYASIKLDLQERGTTAQQTDVVQIDAEVLDFAQEAERQVVSVRFHGLIRELRDGGAEPFDEVWHLVKPNDGSREWAIAGIQPMVAA